MPSNPTQPQEQENADAVSGAGSRPLEFPESSLVRPKRIKDQERDDEEYIRVNPLWIPLDEMPADWILKGREGARWHYSAILPRGEDGRDHRNWRIMLGSEEMLTVIPEEQKQYLLTYVSRYRKKYPDKNVPALTAAAFDRSVDGLGHPTIAVGFASDGKTVEGMASQSGEFHYNKKSKSGIANDKSGRYMSTEVRGQVEPALVRQWGNTVADAIADRLGIPVKFEQIKTAAPAQPTTQQAAALLPPGGARVAARAAGQPAAGPAAGQASDKQSKAAGPRR